MSVSVTWDAAFTACASREFADRLAALSPFASLDAALAAARRIWWNDVGVAGWLEAFAAHPEIGDAAALKEKYANTAFGELSGGEQAAAFAGAGGADAAAAAPVFEELAALNRAYRARHGFIFIICASGRSAAEMLAAVKARLPNAPYEELGAAAREQMRIAELRLAKLLAGQQQPGGPAAAGGGGGGGSPSAAERAAVRTGQLAGHIAPGSGGGAAAPLRSPITTHVLDAALGVPARGLPIRLQRLMDGAPAGAGSAAWDTVGGGVTDADGRIGTLLPPAAWVAPGSYRMVFDTGAYLRACRELHPSAFRALPFYPSAAVEFTVAPDQAAQHYHVPLLLSPYGYSTYRGS